MDIPFAFGKVVAGGQFINREKDIQNLSLSFRSQISTILISPRRWGKSSLVNQVALTLEKQNKETRFCFIDLYSIRSEEEFYETFASELLKATSNKWEEWMKNGKRLITRLIPQFSFGIDPFQDFKVSFNWKQLKIHSREILDLPEKIAKEKKINLVVCIDEFQNITHFDEPIVVQKVFRSVWQHHQSCTYCLYGSKRHMLAEIFENKSMPFYKFGQTIFLEKIEHKHWVKYIVRQFSQTKKSITEQQAGHVASLMENHPYFVQLFAASIWKLTRRVCTDVIIEQALEELILQYSLLYQREVDLLTNKQLNFLKALFDGVEQFSSKHALSNYNLGSQGNVKRIKTALENKEIIDLWGTKTEFIDPLFRIWFGKVFRGFRITPMIETLKP
jgi:hypothetical protein